MKCPQCSAEIIAGAVYCQKCGARLDVTTSAGSKPNGGPAVPGLSPAGAATGAGKALGARGAPVEEVDLWSSNYSGKAMLGQWVIAGVVTIVVLVLGMMGVFSGGMAWAIALGGAALVWLYFAASLVVQKLSVKYKLTNKRLLHEKGLLRRLTDRLEVIDIDDVRVVQGFFERFMSVGTIRIISSDRSSAELVLPGIDDVRAVADLIDNTRRQERERRGVFIESV